MFVDFNKVFSKTPQTELRIPQELIDQLSSKLPDGLKYKYNEKNNNLFIFPESLKESKVSIGGIMLEPNDEQKKILGDHFSFDDIIKLSYNTQQPVPVRFKNGKYVTINGEDIPIEHLSYNPFKQYELVLDSTRILPHPFPPAFSIEIGCEELTIPLSIKRIPNNSITTIAFESDQTKCLRIKYYYNEISNHFSMSLNVSLENATSAKELAEALMIYNAFINGKGKFANTVIDTPLERSNQSASDDLALSFWKKVMKLEDKLNTTFVPKRSDLDIKEICKIEELYQNIINQTPIKHNRKVNSITSEWEFSKETIVNDSLNKPIYLEYNEASSFELFGQSVSLRCIVGVFNAVFCNYEKDTESNKCIVFLDNESDEKKMYTSELCFISEEELLKYKQETKNRIELFRTARIITEYL